jgi:uncharacterized membrane protein (DUF2068 family)
MIGIRGFNGLRAVALFEGGKAVLFLVVGFGLLSLIHRDMEETAIHFVKHLHLNPVHKYPRIFIEASRQVTNTQLWLFAAVAFLDAIVRGVEAVGLWFDRNWAKWLGVVTAALYLPIEIYELFRHVNWLKIAAFVANIVIVVYLSNSLYASKHQRSP